MHVRDEIGQQRVDLIVRSFVATVVPIAIPILEKIVRQIEPALLIRAIFSVTTSSPPVDI
jgi:hypothetical protein